ncbi:MAG TPA: hypothetical protein QF621_03405 [Candidatus Thalassarchaeaceae archaeon]|jgi:predicted regulator of Ras-like GTPase activity (Roadblock/LC7/MglB family)|nr:hypothetical protein [Candidatus Thalassarchaeaceae archaeon]
MLQRLLATFGRIDGVQAAAVVDVDMNEIATFLTPDLSGVDVSVGLQDALRESGRVASVSGIGELEQFWIETDDGNSIIAPLAGGFTLFVSSREVSNIGRLRHEIRARAPVIEDLMR